MHVDKAGFLRWFYGYRIRRRSKETKGQDLFVFEIESPAVPWADVSPGLSSFMTPWASFWLVALTSHPLEMEIHVPQAFGHQAFTKIELQKE